MTGRIIFALALGLLLTPLATATSSSPESRGQTLRSAFLGSGQWTSQITAEEIKSQLQNHFTVVVEQLEANAVTSLNEALERLESVTRKSWTDAERRAIREQLANSRNAMVDTLRSYSARGRFPINRGLSDTAVPIFMDEFGTHCAVGYLMHCSGADAQVREIVESNNLVVVPDVVDGPLVEWILDSGLTQTEAAMIQPAYPPMLEATLDDFAAGETLGTGGGLVMSNMTAKQLELPSPTTADSFATHKVLMDIGGTPYPETNNVGALAGVGDYTGDYDIGAPMPLDEHIFIGGGINASALATPGNMVFMEYELSAIDNQDISQVALLSDPLINSNFLYENERIIVETDILDSDGNLLESMRIDFSGIQYQTLTDIVDIPPTDSLTLRLYAAVYEEGPFPIAFFNSAFHSFAVVPEPGLNGAMLAIFGLVLLRLRVRKPLAG